MAVYYAIITAVVALSYITLRKYLAVHKSILLCISAYTLMCLFPLSVTGIGTGNTIAVYLVAAVLIAYLVNNFEMNTGETPGAATGNKEPAAAAAGSGENAGAETKLNQTEPVQSLTAEPNQHRDEPELNAEIKTETDLLHNIQDDQPEEDLSMEMTAGEENMEMESGLEKDNMETHEELEVFNVVNAEAAAAQEEIIEEVSNEEVSNEEIDEEEIDEEEIDEEEIDEEEIDEEEIDEEEIDEELPTAYSHTEIVRSVVEEEIHPYDEPEELSPVEDKPEEIYLHESDENKLNTCEAPGEQQEENKSEQVQQYSEESCSEIDVDTAAEQKDKEEEAASPLTAKELISQGLEDLRNEHYDKALKLLIKGLKEQPETELTYLAVSKISDIYQHIGMYELAAGIITAYISQEDLAEHPGTKTWKEKLIYLDNLMKAMKENNISNVPYNQLPDFVKKKAFFRTMKKINK